MKKQIEIKTAFWIDVVARINGMIEQGIEPEDSGEAFEIYEMDVSTINAMQSHTHDDADIYDEWVEFMDEVYNVIDAV